MTAVSRDCTDSTCSLNQLCTSGIIAPVNRFMTNSIASETTGRPPNSPARNSIALAAITSMLTRAARCASSRMNRALTSAPISRADDRPQ